MNKAKKILSLLVVALLVSASVGILPKQTQAVGFSFYRPITIDHTKVPNTDQTNFPVLISGTYNGSGGVADLRTAANGGKVQNASGFDIGFYTNSDCTTGKMNWETESYNAATGAVNYWVKIANLSHTADTVFYVCYGNSSITTDQSSAAAVWDANYKGVWHLPNGTSLTTNDSTSNAKNGTVNGSVVATSGQIDGAGLFDGVTGFINGPAVSPSALTTFTVSAWIDPNGLQGQDTAVVADIFGANVNYALHFDEITFPSLRLFGGTYNGAWTRTPSATLTSGVWVYAVLTYDGTNMDLYINNNPPLQTAANVTPQSDNLGFRIGRRWDNPNNFNGSIDEVRISSGARSADWIATEFNNQSSPSTFFTVGGEVAPGSVPPRTMRLFEGFKIKFVSGKIKLLQK